MDSSHPDFMRLDTTMDKADESSKSKQPVVVKEDAPVLNTNETSLCDDSTSIPIKADPECKDLDLCSSSSSNDSVIVRWMGYPLSAVLFYTALFSFWLILLDIVLASEISLWVKVPNIMLWIWGIAKLLPFTKDQEWPEESQRHTIDTLLQALCTQALVASVLAVTLGTPVPSGYCTIFSINLVCCVLCRMTFDLSTKKST